MGVGGLGMETPFIAKLTHGISLDLAPQGDLAMGDPKVMTTVARRRIRAISL